MNKNSRILVTGATGMVGGAIVKELRNQSYNNVIGIGSGDTDLRKQGEVRGLFRGYSPEYVFACAAKVGGIHANSTQRAEFIYDNIMINTNTIHYAYEAKVKKLLFLGSSCIYPRECPQPISERMLLSGLLEETNEPYALAKIAGIKMIESYNRQYGTDYISCMPTNLYGYGDTYDAMNSHVIPALIQKIHQAKLDGSLVTIWGDGSPLREFLFVDDLAKACVFLMDNYSSNETINVGSGEEVSIAELACIIADVIGSKGTVGFDTTKPNGTPRKLLDCTKINTLGWKHIMGLREGLEKTYINYLSCV